MTAGQVAPARRRLFWLAPGLALATLLSPALARAQVADPKADFVQALARFSLALDGTYGDEADAVRAGLEDLKRGLAAWDDTIRSYESAMASEIGRAQPDVAARMHQALGGVYLDRGRAADALKEFAAAERLAPALADVYALEGAAHSRPFSGNRAAAVDAFRKAFALDARNPVRAYVLGHQLLEQGSTEEARKVLAVVTESIVPTASEPAAPAFIQPGLVPEKSGVEPFFPPALYADGFALLQRSEYDRALAQFADAAGRDPLVATRVDPREALGRAAAAFRDGSLDTALMHLAVAIELAPDRAEAHRVLGAVWAADEQYDHAVDELRTAIRLSPADERARLSLASVLVSAERYPAAEDTLRALLAAFPSSGRGRYALGRLYQRQGKYSEALTAFEEAARFRPLLGLNGIYQAMGAMNAARQNFDATIDAYTRRVDVHPNDSDAHYDLGDTYFRVGRHIEALAEFSIAVMLSPKHANAHEAIAQVHLQDGAYGAAVDAARRALAIDPSLTQARYVLGTALVRLGRTDEGTTELAEFQRRQSDAAAAHARELELGGLRREASVSSARGDHERAVALLRQALAIEPNAAVSHLNLGLALLNAGHPAEALERLTAAAALDAPVEVHRYMAQAYVALGRTDDSRRELALYDRLRQEQLQRTGAAR